MPDKYHQRPYTSFASILLNSFPSSDLPAQFQLPPLASEKRPAFLFDSKSSYGDIISSPVIPVGILPLGAARRVFTLHGKPRTFDPKTFLAQTGLGRTVLQ